MILPKKPHELEKMIEGGKKLAEVKAHLKTMVKAGVTPLEIDREAERMIIASGGKPSFKMVPDYYWTTCININDGVVHGIPTDEPFKEGDLAKVDLGMYYKGFHTDTSFMMPVGKVDGKTQDFIDIGREALKKAIAQAKPGNKISAISRAMEDVFTKRKVYPVYDLTGHGVGKRLHEAPAVPCLWEGPLEASEVIPVGATLAIEAIYTLGSPDLVVSSKDHWTIATKDGKIAGLFEETVAVTTNGPVVLTAS
jgi:methionyl aminopeptidase